MYKNGITFVKEICDLEWERVLNIESLLRKSTLHSSGENRGRLGDFYNLIISCVEQNDALKFHSFLILDKTSSIWQLFPQNFGGGNQLTFKLNLFLQFCSHFICREVFFSNSILVSRLQSLQETLRFCILTTRQKKGERENKHVFITGNFTKQSDEDFVVTKSNCIWSYPWGLYVIVASQENFEFYNFT